MLQTVIIDDSQQAVDYLTCLLDKSEFKVKVIGTASGVEAGIDLINSSHPELVFLDIELGDKTGFDLLRQLDGIRFKLIFTTGHNQYALDAFQFNAIHYLLKPVQPKELYEALSRVCLKDYKLTTSVENIKSLLESIRVPVVKKLPLSTGEGTRYVRPADILYIEADGSYSIIKMMDGSSIMLSRLLKDFEIQLQNDHFFRISKSFLINMQYVAMYRRIDGGTVEMINGTLIPVPRRKRDDFLLHMTEYMR